MGLVMKRRVFLHSVVLAPIAAAMQGSLPTLTTAAYPISTTVDLTNITNTVYVIRDAQGNITQTYGPCK